MKCHFDSPGVVLRRTAKLLLLSAAVALLSSKPAAAGDEASQAQSPRRAGVRVSEPAVTAPKASAGMRVHIDPKTGMIGAPPPASNIGSDEASSALFKQSDDLVEEAGTTPAGGYRVDLRGRFRAVSTVKVSPDGTMTTECHTPSSRAEGKP